MKNLRSEAAEKIAERLSWCTAKRDQSGIAKDLAEGKDVSEVYGLGEAGLSFFWHILPVILRSQALMRLVGFNGREVKDGTSERGLGKRKEKPGIRGPLCPDSIAGYIEAITATALESFYPDSGGRIFLPEEGACAPRRLRDSINRKVRGLRFRHVRRRPRLSVFVEQAITNLGSNRIVSVACDRGFLDGSFLWWLNAQGIFFYIPAKSNMDVYGDALALAASGSGPRKEAIGRLREEQNYRDRPMGGRRRSRPCFSRVLWGTGEWQPSKPPGLRFESAQCGGGPFRSVDTQ